MGLLGWLLLSWSRISWVGWPWSWLWSGFRSTPHVFVLGFTRRDYPGYALVVACYWGPRAKSSYRSSLKAFCFVLPTNTPIGQRNSHSQAWHQWAAKRMAATIGKGREYLPNNNPAHHMWPPGHLSFLMLCPPLALPLSVLGWLLKISLNLAVPSSPDFGFFPFFVFPRFLGSWSHLITK